MQMSISFSLAASSLAPLSISLGITMLPGLQEEEEEEEYLRKLFLLCGSSLNIWVSPDQGSESVEGREGRPYREPH